MLPQEIAFKCLISFLAEWQDYKLPTKETYLENHFNTINLMTRINTQFRKLEYLMDNNMSKEGKKLNVSISYILVDRVNIL